MLIFFAFVLAGCGNIDGILYSVDDLNGSQIAVLEHSVEDRLIEEVFPESGIVHFKSSSEFLLALAIGKCDAGMVEKQEGEYLLSRNNDYTSLTCDGIDNSTTLLIVHSRLLP